MAELGEIREKDGAYQLCVGKAAGGGAVWVPYATNLVRARYLTAPDGKVFARTIADELQAEGWIAPDEELSLCSAWSLVPGAESVQCRLRAGHDGNHLANGLEWDASFSAEAV